MVKYGVKTKSDVLYLKSGILPLLLTLVFSGLFLISCNPNTQPAYEPYIVPEMVLVKAGSFQMGDEVGDLWDGCRPVHNVTLTYDFWIGKYEATFEEYNLFCESTDRRNAYDQGWEGGNRPVINVDWRDAIAYCNWLSEKEGLKPAYNQEEELLDRNGNITTDITQVEGYRLPTEAEWEYAASGGHEASPTRFLFSGSNDIDEVAWYFGNSGEYVFTGTSLGYSYTSHGASHIQGMSTHPVGQKKPNELGVYDMSGNVWEWCHDWYGSYTSENKTNPIGPPSGHVRVMRGGSWIFGANDCRVACRLYRPPHESIFRLGFRLARTVF
jgi:formylglycine-generating enzyme